MSAAIGVLIVFIFIAAFVTTGLDSDEFEYFRWVFIGGWLISYLVPIFYSVRQSCRNIHKYVFGLIVMVFMAPTLFVLIIIYSISNIHDCTWGRGALSAEKANKSGATITESYERFRTKILTAFIIVNYAFLIAMQDLSTDQEHTYILIVLCYLAGLLWLKVVFSILNRVVSVWRQRSLDRYLSKRREEN